MGGQSADVLQMCKRVPQSHHPRIMPSLRNFHGQWSHPSCNGLSIAQRAVHRNAAIRYHDYRHTEVEPTIDGVSDMVFVYVRCNFAEQRGRKNGMLGIAARRSSRCWPSHIFYVPAFSVRWNRSESALWTQECEAFKTVPVDWGFSEWAPYITD